MNTVDQRVKGFIEYWRETHCAECKMELTDGNVAIVDRRLVCIKCYESMKSMSGLIADGRHIK